MRISDWSSDVCSSDLLSQPLCAAALADFQQAQRVGCAAVLHVVAAGEHDVVAGGEQAGVVQGLHGVARGLARGPAAARSEKRRVGKECVSPVHYRWSPYP